jgi:hypothetical protein
MGMELIENQKRRSYRFLINPGEGALAKNVPSRSYLSTGQKDADRRTEAKDERSNLWRCDIVVTLTVVLIVICNQFIMQ